MNLSFTAISEAAQDVKFEQLSLQKADLRNLNQKSEFENILSDHKEKFTEILSENKIKSESLDNVQYMANQIPITFKSEIKEQTSSGQISEFSDTRDNSIKTSLITSRQETAKSENIKSDSLTTGNTTNPNINNVDSASENIATPNNSNNYSIPKKEVSREQNGDISPENKTIVAQKANINQSKVIDILAKGVQKTELLAKMTLPVSKGTAVVTKKSVQASTVVNTKPNIASAVVTKKTDNASAVAKTTFNQDAVPSNAQTDKPQAPTIANIANTVKTTSLMPEQKAPSALATNSSVISAAVKNVKSKVDNSQTNNVNTDKPISQSKAPTNANISPLTKVTTGNKTQTGTFSPGTQLKEKKTSDNIIKNKIVFGAEINKVKNGATKVASTNAITNHTFSSVKMEDFISTTTRMIKNVTDNTTQTAKFILKPESLGTIFVEISLYNNALSLDFKADNMEVIKSIESQLPALKEKLSQLGLTTDSIELSYKETSNQDSGGLPGDTKSKHEDKAFKKAFIRSFTDSEIIANKIGSESV